MRTPLSRQLVQQIMKVFYRLTWTHRWQRVPNSPILWRLSLYWLPPLPPFFFQILFVQAPFFNCLVSLAEWMIVPHLMCYLLNGIMDVHISSLSTLVQEKPYCVFYATRRQVYWGLTRGFLLVLWLNWANRLPHPYKSILTPPVMWSQQLSVLNCMHNSLILKFYFPQCFFFSKIAYL